MTKSVRLYFLSYVLKISMIKGGTTFFAVPPVFVPYLFT